jgi:hypothetical protein
MRYGLTLCIVCVTVITMFAAHAADAEQTLTQSSVQAVSRISGSLIHSTMQPAVQPNQVSEAASPSVRAAANEPGDPENITAVCLTSGSNVGRCGAMPISATAASTGCQDTGRYNNEEGAMDEPASWCHGHTEPTYTHAPHVAICDVEDVGLAGCLEKYASSLVKHPNAAKLAYQVNIDSDDTDHRSVTVLVTAKQTASDAEKMALSSIANALIASTN